MRKIEQIQSMWKDILMDWEQVRGRLCTKVINKEWNQEILKKVPYITIKDLAIVFYVLCGEEYAVLICKEYLKWWNVTEEELIKEALSNVERLFPPCFISMKEIICGKSGMYKEGNLLGDRELVEKELMYVLSNDSKSYGAGVLFYSGVMKRIGELLQTNYYVLPSSIHEVIIVPDNEEIDTKNLSCIVQEVNEIAVDKEEWLSNHVYYYSIEEDILTSAE